MKKLMILLVVISMFIISCGVVPPADSTNIVVSTPVHWVQVTDRPDGVKCWAFFMDYNYGSFSGVSCAE